MKRWNRAPLGALAGLLALLAGCEALGGNEPVVPTTAEAAAAYEGQSAVRDVEVTGNLVVLEIERPVRQLERGGTLWARVGPYVYLFSPQTRALFESYPGIAAVRAITRTPDGEEVARATLRRDAMNDLLWRRSLNLLGHALQDGTRRPKRIEELIFWGEERTDFTYSPEYVPE